jgi:hypothetical protein
MMLAIMGYGLAVGALAALAAWLLERAQAALGRSRRSAWIGGILAALVVPGLVIALREPGEGPGSMLAAAMHVQVQGAASAMPRPPASHGGEATGASLNAWLAALWAFTSIALLGTYAFSAWRLARRALTWRAERIGAHAVVIAPDIGPAVFGLTRSRVVIPRWLTAAPSGVQRLALAHEREHQEAHDPQVLSLATMLAALLPWNLPLLWMLRRLRFAMEVDCDARVLRRGADPNDYGLALLYVSERQSRAPVTAIALIERTSQLERRINFMFASPRKYRALLAGACLALAGTCLFAASALEAPPLGSFSQVLKPPPGVDSMGFKLGQRFEVLIREKYPELMGGNFEGKPIIVALVNDDWSIAKSALIPNPHPEVQATNDMFGVLDLRPEEAPYVGAMDMQMAKDKLVAMVYTELKKPGQPFVSSIFPDTRKQDRELFQQQFPGAKAGVAAGKDPWLLLDRSGVVLRKGLEPLTPAWEQTLEKRFGGIVTREVTVTSITDDTGEPLRDAAGKELHLHSIWLAPGSPAPEN